MAASMVVQQLRRAALVYDAASRTDGELVQAFVSRRDQSAFETLVHRHGTMVLNVCRRVLRNEADADDAFQATFLVLVRKAAAIRSPSAVSSWLYGVAHTTALKAKAMNRKRRERELEAGTLPRAEACEEVWRAVQALLDAELASLPEKYLSAIVLCDLECKTIKEAARLRNCPPGTIATRLARGRALLARRLAKHGINVSAAVLACALAHGATAASLPPALVLSTIKATSLCAAGQAATGLVSAKVAALTQGVVQAMFLTKLKLFAAGLVAVTVLSAGVGAIGPGISAQDAASSPRTTQQPPPTGKPVQAAGGDANLKQEVERLRDELAKTRLELQRTKAELAELKAQTQLAAAKAELVWAVNSSSRPTLSAPAVLHT
jgi:RNA polymerase sigma factor (sigma-70 family)